MKYVSFSYLSTVRLSLSLPPWSPHRCTLKRGCALICRHAMWRWTKTDFGMSPDSEFHTRLPASHRERTPHVSTINYVSHPLIQLVRY